MKWIKLIWPWTQFEVMRLQIEMLERLLSKEISEHGATKAEKEDLIDEVKVHQQKAAKHNQDARKMAQILALKGGIL